MLWKNTAKRRVLDVISPLRKKRQKQFFMVEPQCVSFKINSDGILARDREFVMMPADIPHGLHAVTQFKMLLIMIRG